MLGSLEGAKSHASFWILRESMKFSLQCRENVPGVAPVLSNFWIHFVSCPETDLYLPVLFSLFKFFSSHRLSVGFFWFKNLHTYAGFLSFFGMSLPWPQYDSGVPILILFFLFA